jgi:hypothetical protein
VVRVGESVHDDCDEEMAAVDEVEEAAFDLKRAQIAFINILPREERDKNIYREAHSSLLFLSLSLFHRNFLKSFSERYASCRVAVQGVEATYRKKELEQLHSTSYSPATSN